MKEFNKLSERQRNMLRYIEKYTADNGFPPTIRQIGENTGINPNIPRPLLYGAVSGSYFLVIGVVISLIVVALG